MNEGKTSSPGEVKLEHSVSTQGRGKRPLITKEYERVENSKGNSRKGSHRGRCRKAIP